MEIIFVEDIYGRKVNVDKSTQRLYEFDNFNKKITYSAEIIEDDKGTGFWTDYEIYGTIDDTEEKLKTWNNHLKHLYDKSVGYKASENDPDKKIWNRLVDFVKANEEKFFTKSGDFRKHYKVTDKEIKELIMKEMI